MTRNFSLLLACGALALQVNAQTLTVQPVQLQFGPTSELETDSLPITISNPLSTDVNVTGVKFFNTYRQPAFSVHDGTFTVPAGGTYTLYVRFAPMHNIQHNTEMVLLTNSHRGNVSVDLRGQGTYSKSYYSGTQNLAEEALKTSLKSIISANYNSFSYNTARDKMFMTIDNKKVNGQGASTNTLECIYTGRTITGYSSRSDAQNQNFNTEHTFPQGFFNSATPMVSDLHHLFPTDNNANNVRGNDKFGTVTSPTWQQGGSKSNGVVFEPRDVQKGATARALLYFVIRYQDFSNHVGPQESTLKTWHQNFPPTAVHRKRNEDVFAEQRNRNPFIDYPQLVDRITRFSGTSTAPAVTDMYKADSVINYGMLSSTAPVTYAHVVVNNGNQPLTLNNFSLSDAALSFASGSGTSVTLQPGEAVAVQVVLNLTATGPFSANLTYQSNQIPVVVPILANQTILATAHATSAEPALTLFPNPAQQSLTLEPGFTEGTSYSIVVYNSLGQLVQQQKGLRGKQQVHVESLPAGRYMVKTISGQGSLTGSFIKLQ